MANWEDDIMEELDDDTLLPDEVDPFEFPSYPYKSTACDRLKSDAKFTGQIKHKDMEIQDVVMQHVLHFLPAKSACRFKTVSKEWHRWINGPFFAHKQTNLFKDISGLFCQFPGESPSFISLNPVAYGVSSPTLCFLPKPVDVRTTCNGLLGCRSRIGDNAYYICNPVTEEWRMVPQPSLYHGPETAMALAFEPGILKFRGNYELICAVTLLDQAVLQFEIYSSRTNSWRVCNSICFDLDALALNGDGFYIRGFVYWETQSGAVLAFDLKEEEYGIFSLPPSRNPTTGALTEMWGELSYFLPSKQDADDDAWTIAVYGNMNMRLRCIISLHSEVLGHDLINGQCRALAFVNDEKLIVALGTKVIAYHVRQHKMEWLSDSRTDGFAKYLPYVNSLAPAGHFLPDADWCLL